MADLNVELLEASFGAVAPRADELAKHFYDTLFERHPGVQPLFENTTQVEQQAKLLASISAIVGNLRNPDKLGSYLQGLGARHVGYGAEPHITTPSVQCSWRRWPTLLATSGPPRWSRPGPTPTA